MSKVFLAEDGSWGSAENLIVVNLTPNEERIVRNLVDDDLAAYIRERDIIRKAADNLIRVHNFSGIDLTNWQPVLDFVKLVYPNFKIESSDTGPTITRIL